MKTYQPILTNLDSIDALTDTTALTIRCHRAAIDLSPLMRLPKLRSLSIWDVRMGDLAPVAALTELKRLSLSPAFLIDDLRALSGLRQLEELEICGDPSLMDLSPIAGLNRLRSLNLMLCERVSDISPLSGMVEMETLSLYECSKVADLTPLSKMTKLRELYLNDCWRVPVPLREAVEDGDYDRFRRLLNASASSSPRSTDAYQQGSITKI